MKSLLKILSGVMLGLVIVLVFMMTVVEPWIIQVTLENPMEQVRDHYNEGRLAIATKKTQEVINILVANRTIKAWIGCPETEFLEYHVDNLYLMKDVFQGKKGDIEYYFNFATNGYIGNLGINDIWYTYATMAVSFLMAGLFLLAFSYTVETTNDVQSTEEKE